VVSGQWSVVGQYAAVALFIARAQAAKADFAVTNANAPAVAEICVRLDGLPLAIELAARQIAVLTPQSLLDRLGERLDLLHGGPRDAPARQQSLRAAIAGSYGLLDETQQRVFRRLALLPGGFDQQTAAAVTAGLGVERTDLWALLAQLAAKSLAHADPAAPGRLRILESVRAFGAEQLAAAGEDAGVLDAVADWFCGHARELTNAVWGESTAELVARIAAEHDNIRFAVEEAERRHHPRYVPLAILLAASWGMRGDLSQARRLLERVLRAHDPSAAERSEALRRLSVTESRSGNWAPARRYAQDALALARGLGDTDLTSRALNALMFAHRRADDTATVIAIAREDIALMRVSGQPRDLIGSLNNLAWTLLGMGDVEAAQPLIDEALALPGADGADTILTTAGAAALCREDLDTAEQHFLGALARRETYHELALHCCEALAVVAARRSDPERALRLFAAVDAFQANHGFGADPWWSGIVAEATARAWAEAPAAAGRTAVAVGSALTLEEACEYAESGRLPERYEAARTALTPREYQVAELVARGYTNGQISARLGMSDRTVVTHVAHIRTKLDLPTRIHIASWFADQRAATS
jgi:predicted ATPase/DNA-binding CsgD family transcriptional regulator